MLASALTAGVDGDPVETGLEALADEAEVLSDKESLGDLQALSSILGRMAFRARVLAELHRRIVKGLVQAGEERERGRAGSGVSRDGGGLS